MGRTITVRAALLDVPALRALLCRAIVAHEHAVASEVADEILDRWARSPWKKS